MSSKTGLECSVRAAVTPGFSVDLETYNGIAAPSLLFSDIWEILYGFVIFPDNILR